VSVVGKKLAWVLRHRPDAIGMTLDAQGWVEVDVLLAQLAAHGTELSREALEDEVRRDDKQRYAFDETRTRIRAQQGHSIEVALDHPVTVPPATLFHGTIAKFVDAIRREGLRAGERHDVHLSETRATATTVGGRRGKPLILEVRAGAMHEAGHVFRRTPNAVWLITSVPPEWIVFP
jgi:putative RNA 2'-phosphotransferase